MPRTDNPHTEDATAYDHARQELILAACAHDKSRVRELFETTPLGADDATRYLVWAAPDLQMMRFLLERGADANSFSIRLVYYRSLDVLKLLADFGYDVKSKGHIILQDCADSREDLDWLLDQGVDVSLTDPHRQDNGFNLGGGERDHSLKVLNNIAKNGDIELFDHIVSRGADPLRSMSLHAVSLCRDVDKMAAMIDHLLDHYHMDIEADNEDLRDFMNADPDSGSPLMCAIFRENVAAVRKLLERGAKLKWSVEHAIGDCMRGGFLPALGPLLDGGADVDQAFRYAVSRNNVDAAQMCFERGANPTHMLEKWQRMIRRRGRRANVISDSESDGEDDQAEAEEAGGEQEEEDEEGDTESRKRMRIFLKAICNDLPPRA